MYRCHDSAILLYEVRVSYTEYTSLVLSPMATHRGLLVWSINSERWGRDLDRDYLYFRTVDMRAIIGTVPCPVHRLFIASRSHYAYAGSRLCVHVGFIVFFIFISTACRSISSRCMEYPLDDVRSTEYGVLRTWRYMGWVPLPSFRLFHDRNLQVQVRLQCLPSVMI